jgi:hypothetical protein
MDQRIANRRRAFEDPRQQQRQIKAMDKNLIVEIANPV